MKDEKTTRRRATKAQTEAGRANLVAFREQCDGRPAATHGIRTAIASNGQVLPVPYANEVREAVTLLIDAAVVDLGGAEAITSMQRQVLESSRVALTIVTLAARYLSQEGIVNAKTGKPQGLLLILGGYLNTIRLNAETLGLARQARHAGGGSALEAKFAEIAQREAAREQNETENEIQSDSRPATSE